MTNSQGHTAAPASGSSPQQASASESQVHFHVATNFDPKLPALYAALNAKHRDAQIVEIRGALPRTVVGHGRSSWGLPDVSQSQLRAHIQSAHDVGISFNYLLNGYCTDAQKSDPRWVDAVNTPRSSKTSSKSLTDCGRRYC